ncbi:hypothetical protein EJB05_45827 [Eragrostis curvula]|uniref:F-box domain-containing protein n=1 Tax=Eragrostis curvula TaxID=38414 RepID=A0A5J9TLK8_9POAL|nr:hypothetical protein EJB05_45827 [Eragrostis curvula]
MASGLDRISALPDGVLEHVLGFLPANEAVQTSVLARRWRHLWRCMRRLHISIKDMASPAGFNKFVTGLLLLRNNRAVLDEVDFTHYPIDGTDGAYMNIWFQHILSCQVKVLVIRFYVDTLLLFDGPSLLSRHLQKLELHSLNLVDDVLDLSSCPALEILEIICCSIWCERISSLSLKHLLIKRAAFSLFEIRRTRISTPSLVSMQIDYCYGVVPQLESMPSLQTAIVKCASPFGIADYCGIDDSGDCGGICSTCSDESSGCVLLQGLSSAVNLELMADRGMIIFRRDLRWCPTFSNLKTLLLNEWCVANDPGALFCILSHSPVLEKLTLQLAKGPKDTTEFDAIFNVAESLAISKHLKTIEVQCEMVDERVCQILRLLKTLGINFTLKRTKM